VGRGTFTASRVYIYHRGSENPVMWASLFTLLLLLVSLCLSICHIPLCALWCETSIYRPRIQGSVSVVPEQILFKLYSPHLSFSRIHYSFSGPPTEAMNRYYAACCFFFFLQNSFTSKPRFIVFIGGSENERWIQENDRCGGCRLNRICLETRQIERGIRKNCKFEKDKSMFRCI
jgi:hypothetical protein